MGQHIVIIEDDASLLKLLGVILTKEGYRVTELPALHTVEELIELKPDGFIIDEQLPIVTGHIICIILKSNEQTKDIPVILMSGYAELETFATLSKADAFIKKPFDGEAMLRLLAQTLAKAEGNY